MIARLFAKYQSIGLITTIVSVLSTVANLRLDQAQLVAEQQHQKSLIFEGAVFATVISLLSAGVLSWFFDGPMVWAICGGTLANTLIQSLYNYKFSVHAGGGGAVKLAFMDEY